MFAQFTGIPQNTNDPMRPRSVVGTHLASIVATAGKKPAWTQPSTTRKTISAGAPPVLTMIGNDADMIADSKSPATMTGLPPMRSAKMPPGTCIIT